MEGIQDEARVAEVQRDLGERMGEEEEGYTETENQGKNDTVTVNDIGTEPNDHLSYYLGLENHQLTISKLG